MGCRLFRKKGIAVFALLFHPMGIDLLAEMGTSSRDATCFLQFWLERFVFQEITPSWWFELVWGFEPVVED